MTLTTLLFVLFPIYLAKIFSNFHLLISPLSHSSMQEVISSTPDHKMVKPLVPEGARVDLEVTLDGLSVWKSENVAEYGMASADNDGAGVGVDLDMFLSRDKYDAREKGAFGRDGKGSGWKYEVTEYGVFVGTYRFFKNDPSSPFSSSLADSASTQHFNRSQILLPPSTASKLLKNRTLALEAAVTLTSGTGNVTIYSSTMLTKFMEYQPPKPKRYLWKDIVSVFSSSSAPKRMEKALPGYITSHFKPSISVKLVCDNSSYPFSLATMLDVKRLRRGFGYVPSVFMDETGLTSDSYIPLNSTVDSVPLKISFSPSLTPSRYRLLSHMTGVLEAQKNLGFDQADIDDIRRLIADTSILFLAVTMVVSLLHLL